ncbi:hypothetical protein E2C01_040511 [Portunus trituberculatus]|uniref:Uncharacterized protein n=1 Tax=Portunus trituberculatus TaxID=210409 RepID=A0A5B7FMV2_PORTR|nr:hypothetical protein [Portunus trituberculatus]
MLDASQAHAIAVHLLVKDVIIHLRFLCFLRFHILFWYYIFHWCFLEKLQHGGRKSESMAAELPPIGQLRNSLAQFEIASGTQFENAVGPNHVANQHPGPCGLGHKEDARIEPNLRVYHWFYSSLYLHLGNCSLLSQVTARPLPVRWKLYRHAREGKITEEEENVTILKGLDHPLAGLDVLPLLPVPLQTSPNLQWHLCNVLSEISNSP